MAVRFQGLDQWLTWLDGLHPHKMDLGLERVGEVAGRLEVTRPAPIVVTVAGPNGKGSTLKTLESLLFAHQIVVGSTYSPHLHRFNERIAINAEPVADARIVEAFATIDEARGDISLTYFEFGALAALLIFRRAKVQVALLEVGLGGRLDAVNLCDADVAVITSVDLDHQAYLGDDRESIGREKAGILRAGIPLVVGEHDPPASVLDAARTLDCPLYMRGRDFDFDGCQNEPNWHWWSRGPRPSGQFEDLPRCSVALENAATALMAFALLDVPMRLDAIRSGVARASLRGRFEVIPGEVPVVVDVAHNPHGARHLAKRLRDESKARTFAVLGMLGDKDPNAVATALDDVVDTWFLAPVHDLRSMGVEELGRRMASPNRRCLSSVSVTEALSRALEIAEPGDRVLVCGSFAAVAEGREALGRGS
ncbi:MAG: bifunctional tetrahydrofolate synthase/dihydrofolate synthase [Gammaproteobacteria bacterium]|nr:bifunctional tetrahydrofolate synthase/dihydrofolate synthase [Gammaproteobacteria bacterium]